MEHRLQAKQAHYVAQIFAIIRIDGMGFLWKLRLVLLLNACMHACIQMHMFCISVLYELFCSLSFGPTLLQSPEQHYGAAWRHGTAQRPPVHKSRAARAHHEVTVREVWHTNSFARNPRSPYYRSGGSPDYPC